MRIGLIALWALRPGRFLKKGDGTLRRGRNE
jgi:hypothetical protein